MMVMQVVDATLDHWRDFCTRKVRQADVDEWVLGAGTTWGSTLYSAITLREGAQVRRALLNDAGECIAMWGARLMPTPHDGDEPHVWLIASEEAGRRAWAIHRRFWSHEVKLMHRLGPRLHAYAWSNNLLHHQWMLRAGFVEHEAGRIGASTFLHFVRHRFRDYVEVTRCVR